jgi:hypothetical protein
MTLTGYTGSIVKWQRSNDGGSTWTDINNTSAIYSEIPATAGTYLYRVVVQSGSCSPANSNTVSITVDPATIAGTLIGGNDICESGSTGLLTLSGYTGSIVEWQYRYDFGPWNSINNTEDTYETNLSSPYYGTHEYRVMVQNGLCSPAYSNIVAIHLYQNSVGGNVFINLDSICLGDNTGNILLDNFLGNIVTWQRKIDQGSWMDLNVNNNPYAETPDQLGTWSYRAVVQNGICPVAYSTVDSIEVLPWPIANFTVNIIGDTVFFTNLSQNANNYTWNFGDGQTSTLVNPKHKYSQSGQYQVTLTASNHYCSDDTTITIDVSVSIAEFDNARKVIIYPNPSNGDFSIALVGNYTEPVHVAINNMLGSKLYSATLDQTSEIRLHNVLLPGIYTITLTYKDKIISRKITIVE